MKADTGEDRSGTDPARTWQKGSSKAARCAKMRRALPVPDRPSVDVSLVGCRCCRARSAAGAGAARAGPGRTFETCSEDGSRAAPAPLLGSPERPAVFGGRRRAGAGLLLDAEYAAPRTPRNPAQRLGGGSSWIICGRRSIGSGAFGRRILRLSPHWPPQARALGLGCAYRRGRRRRDPQLLPKDFS